MTLPTGTLCVCVSLEPSEVGVSVCMFQYKDNGVVRVLISLGVVALCANSVGFQWLSSFLISAHCASRRGRYVGYIRKALEKGYSEHPGLHAGLPICLRLSSVLEGVCAACCPVLSTGGYHVFIQIHSTGCCFP